MSSLDTNMKLFRWFQIEDYDAQIDQVLPGVHSRMDGMGSNLN